MCEDGHYLDPLDIARLNKRDGEGDIFPYDKWQLIMRSDDSEPPHFHIIRDGWDVIFSIESGKLIRVIAIGDNSKVLDYMIANAYQWLECENKFYAALSNREAAKLMWFQLHD